MVARVRGRDRERDGASAQRVACAFPHPPEEEERWSEQHGKAVETIQCFENGKCLVGFEAQRNLFNHVDHIMEFFLVHLISCYFLQSHVNGNRKNVRF